MGAASPLAALGSMNPFIRPNNVKRVYDTSHAVGSVWAYTARFDAKYRDFAQSFLTLYALRTLYRNLILFANVVGSMYLTLRSNCGIVLMIFENKIYDYIYVVICY